MKRFLLIAILLLPACSKTPYWVTLAQQPDSTGFVDANSIGMQGDYVRARLRTTHKKPFTSPPISKPYRILEMTVLIDCAHKSWTGIEYEAFDENGVSLEKRQVPPVRYFTDPHWDDARGPKLICEHHMQGTPLE